MKVVWTSPWYGDYRIPVYTNLNNNIGGNLKVFYSPSLCTDSVNRKMRTLLKNNSEGLDGKTFVLGKKDGSTFANKQLFIRYQPDLYRKIKEYNPDVIICEAFGGWSIVAWWYALLHRKKLMMFYERTAYVERNCPWWRKIYRKFIGVKVSTFLINGSLTREYLQDKLGFNKKKMVEGVMVADANKLADDVSAFSEEKRQLIRMENGCTQKGLLFLFTGQIVDRKGIKELLVAWRIHIKKYPQDVLIVIGTGVLLESLRKEYENMNSVKLLGQVPYDYIYKYYSAADVFIMPTLEDNWCLVVPEAMACGKPVACSIYNGGHVELVHDGENGYNFDPFNENNILEILAKFHSSDIIKMGHSSKQIISGYTPAIAAKKISDACMSLIR